jgi:hypothetical protein
MTSFASNAATIAPDQYSRLLVGKWSILSFKYNFEANHAFTYTTVFDPVHPIPGTWEIAEEKLVLRHGDGTLQTVGIKFTTPDSWEWLREGGASFIASRITKE